MGQKKCIKKKDALHNSCHAYTSHALRERLYAN